MFKFNKMNKKYFKTIIELHSYYPYDFKHKDRVRIQAKEPFAKRRNIVGKEANIVNCFPNFRPYQKNCGILRV